MFRKAAALAAVLGLVICTATGCSSGNAAEEEIRLPIYGAEEISYEVAVAQYMDITAKDSMGATIGYPYADILYYPADAQVISFNAVKGRNVAEGDVLVELDSADLDYEISNQQTIVNTAYAKYLSGGESARLQYQIEQNKLDKMLQEKESYIIRAPYDGVITSINRSSAGDRIEGGSVCCTVAAADSVEIYIEGGDASKFRFGQEVIVKIDGIEYKATVAMAPDVAPATASGNAAKRAIFKLDDGVLDKIREENPIAISAGWATVYLTTEKKNVLAVPDAAIKSTGTVTSVTIVDGEERFRLPVTVGVSYGGYTEILNGISAGDIVMAEGSGTYSTELKEEISDSAGVVYRIDPALLEGWDGVVDDEFLQSLGADEKTLSEMGIDINMLKGMTFDKEFIQNWDGVIDERMLQMLTGKGIK